MRKTSPTLTKREKSKYTFGKRDSNTYEPLLSTANLARGDTRDTITLEIVNVDGSEEKILRVDLEGLAREGESDGSSGSTRDGEASLTIGLGSRDSSVDGSSISGGSNNESGTSVEDSSAGIEANRLAINGNTHVTFPETVLVDVVEGDESFSVEFGCIETTEGDLAIVLAIRETRDLVGSDGVVDEALLGKSLNGSKSLLLRESLRETQG